MYFSKDSCNKDGGQVSSSGIWVAEVTFKAKSERRLLISSQSPVSARGGHAVREPHGEATCCAQQSPTSSPPSPGTTPGST